ncbi:MAG: hypothetical protein LBE33_03020 [Zoogloeaceae bacterium]|jgi:hypothetical protein|nr:hypothetical protein [Zoogloeaceae bacterium]
MSGRARREELKVVVYQVWRASVANKYGKRDAISAAWSVVGAVAVRIAGLPEIAAGISANTISRLPIPNIVAKKPP